MITAQQNEKRWWIVTLMLFSLLFQGVAIHFSGRTPNILVFDLVLLVTLASVVYSLFVGDLALYQSDTWVTRLFVALFLIQTISLLLNERDIPRGFYSIKVSLFGFLSYLLITTLLRSHADFRRVTYGLVLWGGTIGLQLTLLFFTTWSVDVGLAASYSVKETIGIAIGRNNYLAAMLILVLPIGIAAMCSQKGLRRLLLAAPVTLMGLGLLITMSKGAFLSLIVGSLCAVPLMRAQQLKLRHVMLFMIVMSLFLVLVPGNLLVFNLDMFSFRLANPDFGRMDVWKAAWHAFTEHPLLGVGPGSVYLYNQQVGEDEVDSHNFILQELAEVGIAGAIPFSMILATFIKRAYTLCAKPSSDKFSNYFAVGLFVSLVSTLVHGLVEPTFPGPHYAAVFWICMGLVFVLIREQQEPQPLSPKYALY